MPRKSLKQRLQSLFGREKYVEVDEAGEDASSKREPPDEPNQESNTTANLVAFFVCGILNNFGYVVMLSAAPDLIEHSSSLGPGHVLLADILPTLIIKLTAPFFMHKFKFSWRVTFLAFCAVLAFQLTAWPGSAYIKLLGVVFASISSGGGEITYLSLTSYYHRNTVSTWSSGTGAAGILGSMSYLVATSWIGMTPRQTLFLSGVFPLAMILAFFGLMSREETKVKLIEEPIEDADLPSDASDSPLADSTTLRTSPSIHERLLHIKALLRYMIPLFVVYYAEYTTLQGVSPTVVFKHSLFSKRDQYVYYQALYQIGVFISRSSVNFFPIKKIWILPILQVINLVFLICHVLFDLVPSIWMVFAIMFWEGLLGGATYCNAFWLISTEVEETLREYSLGVTSVADSCGISLAGLTAVFLTPALEHHAH